MSFYDCINSIDIDYYLSKVDDATSQQVMVAIDNSQRNLNDFLALLSNSANICRELIAQAVYKSSRTMFGNAMMLYTPLYLADYCENQCIYCGFNCMNKTIRKVLTMKEIERELTAIYNTGLRDILLLTGESRKHADVAYIFEAVKLAKVKFKGVSIEIYPLEEDEYKQAILAGVNGLTVYQETYCEDIYKTLHIKGPKTNYRYRLETPERAARAGLSQISIGALYGLAPPLVEAIYMFHHLSYLESHFPYVEWSISLPRLKDIGREVTFAKYTIDDALFLKLLMAFRLCFPRVGINLSTRESAVLRDHLVPLGISKLSAGVKTTVGGHADKTTSTPQFNISDPRSVKEISDMLYQKGFQPIYSDWISL